MPADKRQRILDAAIGLFGDQGFDNTPTSAISAAAGIGTGTLFKYFADKDALIREAYVAAKSGMIAAIKEGLNPMEDFPVLFKHVWDRAIDWSLRHPQKHMFMAQFKNSRFRHYHNEALEQEFLFFYVALKGAQETGRVADLPVELLDMNFTGFFNMAVEYISNQSVNPEKARNLIFSMLMKSIGPDQHQES